MFFLNYISFVIFCISIFNLVYITVNGYSYGDSKSFYPRELTTYELIDELNNKHGVDKIEFSHIQLDMSSKYGDINVNFNAGNNPVNEAHSTLSSNMRTSCALIIASDGEITIPRIGWCSEAISRENLVIEINKNLLYITQNFDVIKSIDDITINRQDSW